MDISHFKNIVVLTGAGISVESGIPAFRGTNGLYNDRKAMELASVDGFMKNPLEGWRWYEERRRVIRNCLPNRGHLWLVSLENYLVSRGGSFILFTQNVDGLHQKAGSKNVRELHGNIMKTRCTECYFERDDSMNPLDELPPYCERCGAMMRPGVVWFGEQLPQDILMEAFERSSRCELFLVIGTSSIVWPAAALPLTARKEADAFLIEVNPEKTPLTPEVDLHLAGPASRELENLVFERT